MHEMLILFAGMTMGALFFGGLWWTVQKGLASKRPALWFIASLLLRSALVLCGFYLVAGSSWKSLAVCLSGFIIARFIVMRMTSIRGAGHAP